SPPSACARLPRRSCSGRAARRPPPSCGGAAITRQPTGSSIRSTRWPSPPSPPPAPSTSGAAGSRAGRGGRWTSTAKNLVRARRGAACLPPGGGELRPYENLTQRERSDPAGAGAALPGGLLDRDLQLFDPASGESAREIAPERLGEQLDRYVHHRQEPHVAFGEQVAALPPEHLDAPLRGGDPELRARFRQEHPAVEPRAERADPALDRVDVAEQAELVESGARKVDPDPVVVAVEQL